MGGEDRVCYTSHYCCIMETLPPNRCKGWDSFTMHTSTSDLVTPKATMRRNKQFEDVIHLAFPRY